MRGVAMLSVLFVALLSLPAWAQPVPPKKAMETQDPAQPNMGKTDPNGLQVEPVDIKPIKGKGNNARKDKHKGKAKMGKGEKTIKSEKTDPHGLQVEPVDIKPIKQ